MRELKNPNYDVPGGWYYDCPETDYRVEADTYLELVINVTRHLTGNNLDIPTHLPVMIQDQIAQRIPPEFSQETEEQ